MAFITESLRGLAFLIAALAVSYAVTLAVGFSGNLLTSLLVGNRTVEVYVPFTLATSGPPPFIPDSRRMVLGVGEPGLAINYLAPVIVLVLTSSWSMGRRVGSAPVLLSAAVFAQSLGMLLAIAGGLLAFALVALWRAGHPIAATVAGVAAVMAAIPAIEEVLLLKSGAAASSVTDRGLFDAGSATDASLGDINLLVALGNNPGLAVALIVAPALQAIASVRAAPGWFLIVALSMTAVFSQPPQWQVGGWLLAGMALILVHQTAEAR